MNARLFLVLSLLGCSAAYGFLVWCFSPTPNEILQPGDGRTPQEEQKIKNCRSYEWREGYYGTPTRDESDQVVCAVG